MLHFPQMSSGAMVQVPFERTRKYRAPAIETTAGIMGIWPDPAATVFGWTLHLRGLNDEEAAALGQLFEACRGRLGTFCFLDPAANLIAWSEELGEPVWNAGPMLTVQAGIADPLGTERASRIVNAGQAPQSLTQSVAAPADCVYCLSAYIRADSNALVSLGQRSPSGVTRAEFTARPAWARVEALVNLGETGDTWDFFVETGAMSTVDVFGLQAEAQPGASAYKRSGARTGVYPKSRFAEDELRIDTSGPNVHDCTVQILCSAPS